MRLFHLLCSALLISLSWARKKPKWDGVASLSTVKFKKVSKHSDEFNGKKFNRNKWDPHSLRNRNTGCPKWLGPIDWSQTKHSTYHQTTTGTNGKPVPASELNYRVKDGSLQLKITKEKQSYFKKREYYCDKSTFTCNHNKKIPCYGTTYNGYPILKDPSDPKSYKYVVHDKCKKEPYCIPHPSKVVGSSRKYKKYLAVNLSGKRRFKYGYFETRVKIANSNAITAVWMHDDNYDLGYDRWYKDEKTGYYILESPSLVRSRRWQEIDIVEASNSNRNGLNRKYIPNIHVFAGYKGEFTSKYKATKDRFGPVILDADVYRQPIPRFSPPNPERNNEYHMNYGNTKTLDSRWASDWRTVGMYWSRNEIRFVLDGKETLRLKNTLVHQQMFWTLGTGINRQWAGKVKGSQLGRWSKIDYVRRYTVKTKDGKEPPSKLPLLKIMENDFKDIGSNYFIVDGVFPVRDDGKSLPNPAARFFGNFLSQMSSSGPAGEILDQTEDIDMPMVFWEDTAIAESDLLPVAGEDEGDDGEEGDEEDISEFPTGLSAEEENALPYQESRMRSADEEPVCDKDMARTVFDDANPGTNMAGWATDNGEGSNAGVVPSNTC